MPRTLDFLSTGDFDDVEVGNTLSVLTHLEAAGTVKAKNLTTTGSFTHDSSEPGYFGKLIVNGTPETTTMTPPVRLVVNGDLVCGKINNGFSTLTLRVGGENISPSYDPTPTPSGGGATYIDIPGSRTLTIQSPSSNLTFNPDGVADATFVIPSSKTLSFQTFAGTTNYDPDGSSNSTFVVPASNTLTLKTPGGDVTYNPDSAGASVSAHLEHNYLAMYHQTSTGAKTLATSYALVRQGAGCEFTCPSTGAVVVEVSLYAIGYPNKTLTMALTKDRNSPLSSTSDLYSGTEKVVWYGGDQGPFTQQYYLSGLTPSASYEVGVAMKSTTFYTQVKYGGAQQNFSVTVTPAPSSSDIQVDEAAPTPPDSGDDY